MGKACHCLDKFGLWSAWNRNCHGRLLGLRNTEFRRILELGSGGKCCVYSLVDYGCGFAHAALISVKKNWNWRCIYSRCGCIRSGFICNLPHAQWNSWKCFGAFVHRPWPLWSVAFVSAGLFVWFCFVDGSALERNPAQ